MNINKYILKTHKSCHQTINLSVLFVRATYANMQTLKIWVIKRYCIL